MILSWHRDPDERTYHTVADQTMEDLLVYFEELTEQLGLESGADVEYSVRAADSLVTSELVNLTTLFGHSQACSTCTSKKA